jgi:3-dehydroquinate synthase
LLRSLSKRQWRNGLGEVIKYGLSLDTGLLDTLEAKTSPDFSDDELAGIVLRCCRLKAEVVAMDETERTGKRAILNFGHTVGHALEAVTGLRRYSHGEAVAVGIAAAARISRDLDMLSEKEVERVDRVIRQYGLPAACPDVDPETLLAAIRYDKKTTAGTTKWVLLEEIGRGCTGRPVPENVVRAALEEVCR